MEDENNSLHLSSASDDDQQSTTSTKLVNPYTYKLRIPFPNELFAESAMKAIGVDPPFTETKTRKSTIRREMTLEILDDGITYLNIELSCEKDEIVSLRTCASSMINNLGLVCQTIKAFGK